MTEDRDRTQPDIALAVDWAPAFELVVSLVSFAERKLHPNLDLGPAWVHDLRQRLPAAFHTQLAEFKSILPFKQSDGLLLLLVRACPEPRDPATLLGWVGRLSAGDLYEILGPRLSTTASSAHAEHFIRLPRDLAGWRRALLELIEPWHRCYFQTVDPAILAGLAEHAAKLQPRLGSAPTSEVIEEATNGLWIDPATSNWSGVVLIPQYHLRPLNDFEGEREQLLIVYPAEVVPPPAGAPPTTLLRLTRALADESRLRMLRFLADGPRNLTEVARFAGLTQPTVHHHLAMLRSAGLVRVHITDVSPNRYSLRPRALELLGDQLGAYLAPAKGDDT